MRCVRSLRRVHTMSVFSSVGQRLKSLINEPKRRRKLRSREGYFSFTLRTFYIRRYSTFTNFRKRLTAFHSVC